MGLTLEYDQNKQTGLKIGKRGIYERRDSILEHLGKWDRPGNIRFSVVVAGNAGCPVIQVGCFEVDFSRISI